MDYLRSGKVPDYVEYILYLDANDTFLLGDASELDKAFETYDAELIAAGTTNDFPISIDMR